MAVTEASDFPTGSAFQIGRIRDMVMSIIIRRKQIMIILVSLLLPALNLRAQVKIISGDSIAIVEHTIRKINSNVNFTIIPGPTYNPTQKVGFGVLPMLVYDINKKDTLSPPSSTAVLFYFDFYGSWAVAAQQSFYWHDNKWRAILFAGYGMLKLKFFGIGRDTAVVSNSDANYVWGEENPLMFSATCYRKVVSHFYAGLEYSYTSVWYDGKDSAATAKMNKDGIKTGTTIESKITPTFVWDNRNNIWWTTKGYYAGLTCQLASHYLASSNDFYILSGYVNGYHRLKRNSDRLSLAWRFYFQGSLADVPYDQYSNYCKSDKVMGYTSGKYVNYGEVNAQVEIRYDLWKFIGVSGFLSTGKVFGSFSNFGHSIWLPSAGASIYLNLIPYRNIRMRLSGAISRQDWGFYIGVGQMF
jgi:hypothetical protein